MKVIERTEYSIIYDHCKSVKTTYECDNYWELLLYIRDNEDAYMDINIEYDAEVYIIECTDDWTGSRMIFINTKH